MNTHLKHLWYHTIHTKQPERSIFWENKLLRERTKHENCITWYTSSSKWVEGHSYMDPCRRPNLASTVKVGYASFPKDSYEFWLPLVYTLTGETLCTPHLNGKKLSTNSSWDFEHVFQTVDNYWVGPDEIFFPESTPTRWRCDHFSKKWSKSKSDTTLSIKKPFVTPNFCGRNFSTMHHFWVWIFLSPKIDE